MSSVDCYQLTQYISDTGPLKYQHWAQSDWFAEDTSSASGSHLTITRNRFQPQPALTQPLTDFEEQVTQLSFKVCSEPVGLAFFGNVVGSPTVPFRREFEDDLGE